MRVTRLQLRRLIKEELSTLLEQETIPAKHLILVGTPTEMIIGTPNTWAVSARVTDLEGGIIDAHDVRGAASDDDAMTKLDPWIKEMQGKYEDAKVKKGGAE